MYLNELLQAFLTNHPDLAYGKHRVEIFRQSTGYRTSIIINGTDNSDGKHVEIPPYVLDTFMSVENATASDWKEFDTEAVYRKAVPNAAAV